MRAPSSTFRIEIQVSDYVALLECAAAAGVEIGDVRMLPHCDCDFQGVVEVLADGFPQTAKSDSVQEA